MANLIKKKTQKTVYSLNDVLLCTRTSGVTFGISAAIKWRSSSLEKSPSVYSIYIEY